MNVPEREYYVNKQQTNDTTKKEIERTEDKNERAWRENSTPKRILKPAYEKKNK